ncbi:Nucleotide-binding, alpha-beta plait [Cynara cardunculus var. scolymus]|uniref:Nucleotide-binding, alpha-beta plait n=1 Tax=Cynara cardunculus var. scolymus TaxID=59895 RepID=A0A118JSK1_CYNCS|nr:Nucleotide-binding, alpha-beta plait [Cynara cardunculus var. scolymus]
MEDTRRLNPQAPPFYPSTFHHLPPYQPPLTDQTKLSPSPKSFLRYPLTPVPTGPRIRGGRCNSGRRAARAAAAVGRRRDDGNDRGRRQLLWRRRGVYREIMPLNPDENSTSVMIRNIPNNYTRELLVEFLENHCKHENENEKNTIRSSFDFLYLPVDFKYYYIYIIDNGSMCRHRLNAGYAFVNFTSSDAAWRFHKSIKGKHWDLFESKKIADVTRAKIQGKEALVKNFERMQLRSPSWDYLPVWFDPPRDGCSPSSSSSSMMKMHTIGSVE